MAALTKSEKFLLNRKGEYTDISCINCSRHNRIYSKKRPITFFCEHCKTKNTYPIINKKLEVKVNDMFYIDDGEGMIHIIGIEDKDNIVIDRLNNNKEWYRELWSISKLVKKNNIGKLRKSNNRDITEFINRITPLTIGTKLYHKDERKKGNMLNNKDKNIIKIRSFSLDENGERTGAYLNNEIFIGGKNTKELKSKILIRYNILITREVCYEYNSGRIKRILRETGEE